MTEADTEADTENLRGRTIRMMREAHGVSTREFARWVGISHSHLVRIETGERTAGPDLLDRIHVTLAGLPATPPAEEPTP